MMERERLQKLAGIEEIIIKSPNQFSKISLDAFKNMIFEGWKNSVIELFDEDKITESIESFKDKLMDINDKYDFCEKASEFLEEYGFGEDQFVTIIVNTLIR